MTSDIRIHKETIDLDRANARWHDSRFWWGEGAREEGQAVVAEKLIVWVPRLL